MLSRLLLVGLIAGTAAAVVATIFQLLMIEPLILKAENFENNKYLIATHFKQTSPDNSFVGPKHLLAVKQDHKLNTHLHNVGEIPDHIDKVWKPSEGFQRRGFTFLANLIVGIAFGILLATALTLYGKSLTLIKGLFWGVCGFLVFGFFPALGLPPEIPGSTSGELFPRQVWWLSTAMSSALGLATLILCSRYTWKTAGLLLIILPHLVGVPDMGEVTVGVVPPELAAKFVVNTLFSMALMWLVLGMTSAYVMQRSDSN